MKQEKIQLYDRQPIRTAWDEENEEPTQKYRITFTTSGSEGMPYEVCLNHGGEEKDLGGIFGLSAMAEGDTITYVTTPDKDIDLVLQFSLGNAWTGGSFTVRNIKVEKAGASSTVSNVTYTF